VYLKIGLAELLTTSYPNLLKPRIMRAKTKACLGGSR